ncbi:sulfhydryl oxidase 1 [Neolamprologus brichardi]|uniref:sulfhydryl oxidase 1 n=1 Tax=Neolamprologus brichardi TaxID=32507 RepID=UPI001643930F|nr:sulfhydryl oxidase 1 [Neolamprologus brichardi]
MVKDETVNKYLLWVCLPLFDVCSEWKPAVDLAAIDCADQENRELCKTYKVRGYPTIKFFHAYSKPDYEGLSFRDFSRNIQDLRHKILDKLETHGEAWPPACPPLEPTSFSPFLHSDIEARAFYSYALQRLPGVVRSGKPPPVSTELLKNNTEDPWRPFDKFRVYMADLESALHYSLRVELGAQSVFQGRALTSLKAYISVLAKYFPGRPIVTNLLKDLNSWLQKQTADRISYEAFKEKLENDAQAPNSTLPDGVRWVGCQGSQPHFRRYPCGVWTLFHVLTVQANGKGSDPQEVLDAMRSYVHNFFGCRECAAHFENMAAETLEQVTSLPTAVLWLWSRHNVVNNRLAGALSEDPQFPKMQWPPPDVCSACHAVKDNGEHTWNLTEVLKFLLTYFSSDRILTDYLESESQILEKRREKHGSQQVIHIAERHAERRAREALDFRKHPLETEPTEQEEEEEKGGEVEEEEEGPQDETAAEEEEEDEEDGLAGDMVGRSSEPTPWAKPEMELGHGRQQARRRPSFVRMRRDPQEDIVDLDSFVNQHYKAKALQMATSTRVKRRSLQRKEEQEPGPVFGLGMELGAGLGMVGLEPMDAGFDLDFARPRKRLQKRDVAGLYFGQEAELRHKGRLMSVLSIGFSKVDISLCVFLYFLSSLCLLLMYLFFKNRLRRRRPKISVP